MRKPDIKPNIPTWGTHDGRQIPITELEDQHLCNCYWHSKIIWGEPHHLITAEVTKRFKDKPLPFKPLPFPKEIQMLRDGGNIQGNDIVLDGKKIGSISHLNPLYTII